MCSLRGAARRARGCARTLGSTALEDTYVRAGRNALKKALRDHPIGQWLALNNRVDGIEQQFITRDTCRVLALDISTRSTGAVTFSVENTGEVERAVAIRSTVPAANRSSILLSSLSSQERVFFAADAIEHEMHHARAQSFFTSSSKSISDKDEAHAAPSIGPGLIGNASDSPVPLFLAVETSMKAFSGAKWNTKGLLSLVQLQAVVFDRFRRLSGGWTPFQVHPITARSYWGFAKGINPKEQAWEIAESYLESVRGYDSGFAACPSRYDIADAFIIGGYAVAMLREYVELSLLATRIDDELRSVVRQRGGALSAAEKKSVLGPEAYRANRARRVLRPLESAVRERVRQEVLRR